MKGRRIICKKVNGTLTVRMGGGFMPLIEYLKKYSADPDNSSKENIFRKDSFESLKNLKEVNFPLIFFNF